MKPFYEPGFLLDVPPARESTAIKTFPTPSGDRQIIWNIDQLGFHILRLPDINTIQRIVQTAVEDILRIQWRATILHSSPPCKTNTPGLRPRWVAEHLSAFSARPFWALAVEKRASLLFPHCPTNLAEAIDRLEKLWLASKGNVSAISPRETGIRDSRKWLRHFYGLFWQNIRQNERVAFGVKGRQPPSNLKGRWGLPVVVACALRREGYILGQQDIMSHIARFFSANFRDGNERLIEYLEPQLPIMTACMLADFNEAERGSDIPGSQRSKIRSRAMEIGFCTNVESRNDISWSFADSFRTPSPNLYYTYSARVTAWLSDMAKANGGGKRSSETQEDPFMNLVERYRAKLPKWVELLAEYRKTIVVKNAREKARIYLGLLDWASSRPECHDPILIRRKHIRDDQDSEARTFHRKLRDKEIISKTKNAELNAAYALFDFVALRHPGFRNPIFIKIDSFPRQVGERSSIGKTYRKRIPSYVLEDLKDFLVTPIEGGFRWGDWVIQQEFTIIGGKSVFCPLRPAILALLASWPLRINQVSWLDSGELDELTFDFGSKTFAESANGLPGRRMGVVQPALDGETFDEAHRLDLLVGINKRPLGEAADYTIPYMDERTLWIVQQVRQWQQAYGRPAQLVREADSPYDNNIAQDKAARELMPEICPLFRDPNHRGLFPPSYARMKSFWTSVCEAYDQHNANWHNPKTGTIEARRGWPQLSKQIEQEEHVRRKAKNRFVVSIQQVRKVRYRYDLYSLKVGGVSHLLDRGIPLAIVSAMAGHRSYSMTLRYFVLDRTLWRKKLSDLAKEDVNFRMRPDEIEARLRDISSHKDWLLGNSTDAFTALQHAVAEGKNFTISTTGICPGTRCEEGLRLKKVKSEGGSRSGVVPGSLCGLCDFRVYGPPFLIGLAKEFNETIYTLSELAARQQFLRAKQRSLEAGGQSDEAIVCRNEDEELSRRSEPDCAHAARLYEMINECVRMAERSSPITSSLQPALLRQKPSVRPTLEMVGPFEQWKEILDMAEVLPATKSLVPDQVSARFQNKLMGVLARNGATPFLAVLPAHIARKASLEFASLLEKAVPSSELREDVFEGRRLLSEIGVAAENEVKTGIRLLDERYRTSNQIDAPVRALKQLSPPASSNLSCMSTNENSLPPSSLAANPRSFGGKEASHKVTKSGRQSRRSM